MIKLRCKMPNSEDAEPGSAKWRCRIRVSNRAPIRVRRWLIPTRIVWGTLIIVLLILLGLVFGNATLRVYKGFGERNVWDWLSLFLTCLAVVLVLWLLVRSFSRQQRDWLVPTRVLGGILIAVLIVLGLVLGYVSCQVCKSPHAVPLRFA